MNNCKYDVESISFFFLEKHDQKWNKKVVFILKHNLYKKVKCYSQEDVIGLSYESWILARATVTTATNTDEEPTLLYNY